VSHSRRKARTDCRLRKVEEGSTMGGKGALVGLELMGGRLIRKREVDSFVARPSLLREELGKSIVLLDCLGAGDIQCYRLELLFE
jgi:hypothetical protein